MRALFQENSEESQILNLDVLSKFVFNSSEEWQLLTNKKTNIGEKEKKVICSFKLDPNDYSKIVGVGYLYNSKTLSAFRSESAFFRIYKITNNPWTEEQVISFYGTIQDNNYFYTSLNMDDITGVSFDGESSFVVDVTILRKSLSFTDRFYFNFIEIYSNVLALKQKIDFLDITKKDE